MCWLNGSLVLGKVQPAFSTQAPLGCVCCVIQSSQSRRELGVLEAGILPGRAGRRACKVRSAKGSWGGERAYTLNLSHPAEGWEAIHSATPMLLIEA